MSRLLVILSLFLMNSGGILMVPKAVDPAQRYFRIIALGHMTDPAGKWKTFTTDVTGNLIMVVEPDPSLGPVTTSIRTTG